MKLKWKTLIVILVLISVIAVISGCITSSVSNTTKHFDYGFIAFDYPSNMKIVDYWLMQLNICK
jgi:hypothetical protein